mgnify:CR=1 FL=1
MAPSVEAKVAELIEHLRVLPEVPKIPCLGRRSHQGSVPAVFCLNDGGWASFDVIPVEMKEARGKHIVGIVCDRQSTRRL